MALTSFAGANIKDALASEIAKITALFEEDVELSFHNFEKGHVIFSVDKVNGIVPGHKLLLTWDDDNAVYASGTAELVEGRAIVYDLGSMRTAADAQFVETLAQDNYFGVRKLSLAEMLAEAYERIQRNVDRAAARELADEALGVSVSPEELRAQAELYKGDVLAYANEITRYAFVQEMDFERACAVIGYEPEWGYSESSEPNEHYRFMAQRVGELNAQAERIEGAWRAWGHEPWLLKGGAAEKEHCVELSSPGLYFAELPMSGRVDVYDVMTYYKNWDEYASVFVAVDANSGRTLEGTLDLVKACVEELAPNEELVKRGLDRPLLDADGAPVEVVVKPSSDMALAAFAEEYCEWSAKFELAGPEILFGFVADAINDPVLHDVWQVDETWKPSFEWEWNKGKEFLVHGRPEPRRWEPQGGEIEKALCSELSAVDVLFAEFPMSGHVNVQMISTDLTYGSEEYVHVVYDAETGRTAEENIELCKACVEELLPEAAWVKHGLDTPYFDAMSGEALESAMELDQNLTLLEFAQSYAEFYSSDPEFADNLMKVYEAVTDAFRAPGLDLDRDWKREPRGEKGGQTQPGEEKGSGERKPGELKSAGKPPKQPTAEVEVCPDWDMENGRCSSKLRNDLEHARAAVAAINAGRKK